MEYICKKRWMVAILALLLCVCTFFGVHIAIEAKANTTETKYEVNIVGSSIRIADDGKNGIRFMTKIPSEDYAEIKNNIVQTGTLFLPAPILGDNELTLETPKVAVGVSTSVMEEKEDGAYTVVYIYGIPEQAHATDICVRSYVKLSDGTVIYGRPVECSLAYVATSVLNDPSYFWTDDQKIIINSYRPEYTVTFDGEAASQEIRWGDKLADIAPTADEGYKKIWYNGQEEYDLNEGVKSDLALASTIVKASSLKETNVLPYFKDDGQKMMISSFQEPRNSSDADMEVAFQNIVDSGINTVFSWGFQERYLNFCAKYNLKYLPYLGETTMLDMINNPIQLSPSQRKSMKGFYYIDEPSYNQITQLSDVARMHIENYPELDFFVNLHPCWTDAEGVEDNVYNGHTYEEYVKYYCETVFSVIKTNRIISVDVYPLIESGNEIKEDWLKTYSIIAKYAKMYDAEMHVYLCAMEHNGYRAPTLSNLKYMSNVAISYGADAIGYFTYVSYEDQTTFKNGLVSPDGLTKYDSYFMAQTLNTDLLKWDEVLRGFTWQDNMCVDGTGWFYKTDYLYDYDNYKVASMDIIEKITASRETIVGRFTSQAGSVGLMLTNFSDPVRDQSDKVEIVFTDGDYIAVYKDGVRTIQELTNKKYSVTLGAGEAVFVIPYKLVNDMQAKSGCSMVRNFEQYYDVDGISYEFTAAQSEMEFTFTSYAPRQLTEKNEISFYIKAEAGLTATLSCDLTDFNKQIVFNDDWIEIRIPTDVYLTAINRGSGLRLTFNNFAGETTVFMSPLKMIEAWSDWVPAD